MTMLTGDPFFPGGIGEFKAGKDEFLIFEDGPSVDVTLQWATYRDASDQTSLSRIWGGIHPPADDIPGRIMGEQIGIDAFHFGERYFDGIGTHTTADRTVPETATDLQVYPNPVQAGRTIFVSTTYARGETDIEFYNVAGQRVATMKLQSSARFELKSDLLSPGLYIVRVTSQGRSETSKIVVYP
jgi:hypothetical protein